MAAQEAANGRIELGAARALETALLASAAMDGGAQPASSERRPGRPQRTSGDRAWAAPSGAVEHRLETCATGGRQAQVTNLCYWERTRFQTACEA